MSSKIVILVTGATGMAGREVCRHLVGQPGVEVRAAVHSPAKRQRLPDEVSPVPFDTAKPETVQAALEGVQRLFLATPGGPGGPPATRAIMDGVTRQPGIERIVKLSSLEPEREPQAPTDLWALETEAMVRESSIPYTFLRPPWFDQNFTAGYFVPLLRERMLALPFGDGEAGWVDARDIAAIARIALLEDGHAGQVYVPTGPELTTLPAIAAVLTEMAGRQIRYHAMSDAEWFAAAEAQNLPREVAAAQLALISKTRDGHTPQLTDDVERLTGQSPRSFADFARDHAEEIKSLCA